MWHPYNRHFLYGRMAQQHPFNLHRRDVLTTADDDILDPITNFGVTIGMHNGGIPCMKPAIAYRPVGSVRIVEVTFHHYIALYDNFAQGLPIMRDFFPIDIHNT